MTSGQENQSTTGEGAPAVGVEEIEAVDPEAVAALDDEPDSEKPIASGDPLAENVPPTDRFDGFVRNVDAGRVAPTEGADEEVPIDASMDELFAER